MTRRSDAIASVLKANYSIDNAELCQLGVSATQTTMLVKDGSNRFVLKSFYDRKAARLVAEFQNHLHSEAVAVPAIVKTFDKRLFVLNNSMNIVLLEYVDGSGIGWAETTKNLNVDLVESIATRLADMHRATLAFKTDDMFDFLTRGTTPVPSGGATKGIDTAELRTAIIHGDLTRENIITNPSLDYVVSIIDFGDSTYGYLVYDLAVLLTQVFITKTWGIDFKGIEVFMNYYTQLNPLSPTERKALVAFMLYKNSSLIHEINSTLKLMKTADESMQSIKRSAEAKINLIHDNEQRLRSIFE